MFPRYIWLGCLASSSEWNFICFCCVPVGWKETVLVLWATCKHSVGSPDWSCALAFWKGRVCPFPFGWVTLLFPCFDIDITVVVQPDQHLQIFHINHLAFVLATRFWLLHILNILKLQIFLLASCSIVCGFINDFFPLSPIKVRYWGKKSFACLLPDACIFSWVNWRENRPWWLSIGFVPCVTDGPTAFMYWSV